MPAVRGARCSRPRAFAVTSSGTGRPVPHNRHVRIGSTTKTLVATVLLQLVGEGQLSLEDSVDKWLPAHSLRTSGVRRLRRQHPVVYQTQRRMTPASRAAQSAAFRLSGDPGLR
ncbi:MULTISPECIES: serine hydrolase [Streptomyces]|uniref:serine hydrolase n=1 Tax=Streptomyces TaxID=1883 RepID=UPI00099F18AB|nr:serine hydrolase [Streptomyces hygroscopicus subsp. hygroscopicus]